MMRTSWPLEPAAFLTQAWNSPSAEGVQAALDLRVGQKIADRISRAAPYERWLPRRLCREHAAKSEMTGCAAYGMTLSSRGSVAMAVRRCAQVRTALDNSPILFADVFSARRTACMNRRVARRRVVGQPRSGRPLPDVAGDVVEAVPVSRKPLYRRCRAKATGQKILPRESALPGVDKNATI